MHGLINTAIQAFVTGTYGRDKWLSIASEAELPSPDFETMLIYKDRLTEYSLVASEKVLMKPRDELLEDIGTFLVSDPRTEALRRLLRFGGDDFIDFLFSLDELHDRARLAVSDLSLPELELRQETPEQFLLFSRAKQTGWGYVMIGILRAMADDYGALVFLEYGGAKEGVETVVVSLVENAFAQGRDFDLGAGAR